MPDSDPPATENETSPQINSTSDKETEGNDHGFGDAPTVNVSVKGLSRKRHKTASSDCENYLMINDGHSSSSVPGKSCECNSMSSETWSSSSTLKHDHYSVVNVLSDTVYNASRNDEDISAENFTKRPVSSDPVRESMVEMENADQELASSMKANHGEMTALKTTLDERQSRQVNAAVSPLNPLLLLMPPPAKSNYCFSENFFQASGGQYYGLCDVRCVIEKAAVNPDDVMMGASSETNKHGNQQYKAIISELYPQYSVANNLQKRSLITDVIKKVCEKEGRFIQKAKNSNRFLVLCHDHKRVYDKIQRDFKLAKRWENK